MQHLRISTVVRFLAVLTISAGSANAAHRGSNPRARTAKPDTTLASEAKVSMEAAKATALAKVPGPHSRLTCKQPLA